MLEKSFFKGGKIGGRTPVPDVLIGPDEIGGRPFDSIDGLRSLILDRVDGYSEGFKALRPLSEKEQVMPGRFPEERVEVRVL